MVREKKTKARLMEEIEALRAQIEQLKTASNTDKAKDSEVAKLEQAKARFVEAVAHELRTPVTPLKSVVEMFLDGMLGEITTEQRGYLEMMQRNIERLTHFISEITNLSKLDSGVSILRPKRMSIFGAVRAAVEMLSKKAKKRSVTIHHRRETELFAYADPDAVCTVVTNLVDNALVHNPEGTEVTISTQLAGRESVEISVSDDGRGIPEESLDDLFEKFSLFRREHGPGYGGAGIGLSVCKTLVERMGGEISVESQTGKGTTFRFTLPIKAKTGALNSH